MGRRTFVAVAAVALATAVVSARAADQPRTFRVSLTGAGAELSSGAWPVGMSADGTTVLFRTADGRIDLGHPQGGLFVRDVTTGETRWVAGQGLPAGYASPFPRDALSADGRTIVYVGADGQVHAVDRETRADAIVSVDGSGAPAPLGADRPSVSADGALVAFVSASVLAPGLAQAPWHVYVRDRKANRTVPVDLGGGEAGLQTWPGPTLSSDGNHLVFATTTPLVAGDTNGALDVYAIDFIRSTRELVSVTPSGTAGGGPSWSPAASADGDVVTFTSTAPDLISGDTDRHADIFVRRLSAHTTVRAHPSSSVDNLYAFPSPGGRFVVVTSADPNFVPDDMNVVNDVFVFDLVTRRITRVSLNYVNSGTNKPSFGVGVSDDGRWALMGSYAALAQDDRNDAPDAYDRDRWAVCDDGGFEEGVVSQPVHQVVEPRAPFADEPAHDMNCDAIAWQGL